MKVTILLLEKLSLFELACAVELFALPREDISDWYQTKIVSLSNSTFEGLCSSHFTCEHVNQLEPCDLLVIPSFPVEAQTIDDTIRQEILKHFNAGGRIISFCSGSFLLAALGLLDNREATTHWRYSDEFRARFPGVIYREDILYTYDGVIGCSAGSAAGIDLGIEVIRQDYGHKIANSVARRLVLPAHRSGGQAQFVEKPLETAKSVLSNTLDWAVLNLTPQLSIADIAAKANMTRRTFDRQFIKHYKITPLHWLMQRKLDVAKTLLESTQHPIEHIAEQSGFESAVTLRHNFKKYLSISPREYRGRFKR
ncbi:helix-turn-helix domain-containing protein [Pseudoalteromonas sp. YIC-656]|uniref:GlxA family transcriptional regulator n=1 Tax=Pseudoalteromonas pernae TaxID=3118054 RepID=UPI00324218DC